MGICKKLPLAWSTATEDCGDTATAARTMMQSRKLSEELGELFEEL